MANPFDQFDTAPPPANQPAANPFDQFDSIDALDQPPVQAGFGREVGVAATGFNRMLGSAVAFPFEAAAGFNEMTGINAAYEGLTGLKADRRPLITNEDAQGFIDRTFGATNPEGLGERMIAAGGAGLGAGVIGLPALTALGLPAVTPAAAAAGGFTGGAVGQVGTEAGTAIGGPIGGAIGGIVGNVVGGAIVPSTLGGSAATAGTARALARPLTQAGRESVVGEILNRAGATGSTELADEAVTGINATLGQRTGNRGVLALEKTQAQSSPEASGEFHEGLARGQAIVRDHLERLRGGGNPERARQASELEIANADNAAASELHALQSGRTQAQASDIARQRIEATRQAFRERENQLWGAIRGDGAMVEVDPLRVRLREFLSGQPKAYDNAMPPEIQAALQRLNPQEPLSEVTPIRTMLREEAQAARASNNPRMARIYSGLENAVGQYLDNLRFPNARVERAYQEARAFSRQRATLFNQQGEVRGTLAADKFGGERTSSAETLGNFIRPGPGGRDTIRQLTALDNTPEMRSLISDHFVASLPENVAAARTWLNRLAPALSEFPQLRAQLTSVVDRRAAAQALRESPFAMFANVSPEKGIQKLIGHPDARNQARAIRTYLTTRGNQDAWRGIVASYADEIARRVGSLVEQDANGRPTILPGKIAAFVRDNSALSQEILGPQGYAALRNISDATQMLTRTSRGGFPGGSDTFSKISGVRFVDKIVEAAMNERAPAAAGASGFGVGTAIGGPFVGGPIGGAIGYGGAAVARSAYSNARTQIDMLLSEALRNPELGRALMQRASQQSLQVMPREIRGYLSQYAVGAGAGYLANQREGKKRGTRH